MCNLWNSSKWYEDIEIFKNYTTDFQMKIIGNPRENIDWDYIYENSKDKAKKIYIAGGEPFI